MMSRDGTPSLLLLACLIACAGVVVEGWIPTTVIPRPTTTTRRRFLRHPRETSRRNDRNDDDDDGNVDDAPEHVFLVSWEGCLVDTVSWRTEEGLAACRAVWPDLEVLLTDDDATWLYNKVRDLHHVLTAVSSPRYSPTVEYALLIRLLLEEQELDRGRSNGSRGKYGSKYHPRVDDEAFTAVAVESDASSRRQRPLTVGEIAANWGDSLREAVLIRYHREEGRNPLDLLQEAVTDRRGHYTPPTLGLRHGAVDERVLRDHHQHGEDSSMRIVVTIPHASDATVVEASLRSVPHVVCDGVDDAASRRGVLPVVVCRHRRNLVREILATLPAHSSLTVLESSWPVLRSHVHVFGEDVPRRTDRPQPSVVSQQKLQLSLWRNDHPDDRAAALMNAWTHCADDEQWPRPLRRRQQQPVTTNTQRRR